MIHRIVTIIATASGAIAVCSLGYYILCLYSAARFLGRRKAAGEGARPTLVMNKIRPTLVYGFKGRCACRAYVQAACASITIWSCAILLAMCCVRSGPTSYARS